MQAPDSVALALVVHTRGTKALSTFTLGEQTREVWSAFAVRQSTTAIALHPSGSIGVDLTSNLADAVPLENENSFDASLGPNAVETSNT
jgi:hypothetical protein